MRGMYPGVKSLGHREMHIVMPPSNRRDQVLIVLTLL